MGGNARPRTAQAGRLALAVAAAALLAACSSTAPAAAPTSASSGSAGGTSAPATPSSSASPSTSSTSPSTSASVSTSATASSSPKPSSATPTPKPTRDPALEGTWHADAASILAADLGRTSLRGFTTCTGPVVLTFTAQGRLVDQGQITCQGAGPTGHGQFSSAGRYTADGSRLVVTRAATRCTLQVAGVVVPCAFAYSNGTARYVVSGSRLTLTFSTTAGLRTQNYTR